MTTRDHGEIRTIKADRGDARRRLDLVLRRALADVDAATRSRIQAWIADGRIAINGVVNRRAATRVATGDVVTVTMPRTETRYASCAGNADVGFTPDIILEDPYFIAVNKAPGIVAHPTHAHSTGTLLDALIALARDWPAGARPSLVGRLDKLTSGVILVAKTAASHAALQRALASPATHKDYLAVVYGRVPMRGHIDLPLRRDRIDRRRVVAAADGAPSRTDYERLAFARGHATKLSLIRCRLVTGRTHQIRVHLAASGWPIVGDPVYGEPRWQTTEDVVLRDLLRGFGRQALHAWRLSFVHPVNGDRVTIEAPPPPDLARLIAAITGDTTDVHRAPDTLRV